jgi:hypothetical protein
MSTPKYFQATPVIGFETDHADHCYTLDVHQAEMQENGEAERILYRAAPEPTTHFFYCHHYGEPYETSEGGCGKVCDHYTPRNGRSGRCRHHGHCYTADHERTKLLRSSTTTRSPEPCAADPDHTSKDV